VGQPERRRRLVIRGGAQPVYRPGLSAGLSRWRCRRAGRVSGIWH